MCNLEENHLCISYCTPICSVFVHTEHVLPPSDCICYRARDIRVLLLLSILQPWCQPQPTKLQPPHCPGSRRSTSYMNGQGAPQAFVKFYPTAHLYCSLTRAAASRSAPPEWAAASTGPTRRQPRSSPVLGETFPEQYCRSAGRRPGSGDGRGRPRCPRRPARPCLDHGTGRYGRRRQSGPWSVTTTRSNVPAPRSHEFAFSAPRGRRRRTRTRGSHGAAGGRGTRRSFVPAAPPGPRAPHGAAPSRPGGLALPSRLPHCAAQAQRLPGSGAFAISGLPARSQAVLSRVRCSPAGRSGTLLSGAPSAFGRGPAPPRCPRR